MKTYIAGADWEMEFWDFNIDILENNIRLKIRNKATKKLVYDDENLTWGHEEEEMTTCFYIPASKTKDLEEWEYEYILLAENVNNEKIIATSPITFMVVNF